MWQHPMKPCVSILPGGIFYPPVKCVYRLFIGDNTETTVVAVFIGVGVAG